MQCPYSILGPYLYWMIDDLMRILTGLSVKFIIFEREAILNLQVALKICSVAILAHHIRQQLMDQKLQSPWPLNCVHQLNGRQIGLVEVHNKLRGGVP